MRGLLVILFLVCSVGLLACGTVATSAPETDSPPGMLERPAPLKALPLMFQQLTLPKRTWFWYLGCPTLAIPLGSTAPPEMGIISRWKSLI